MRMSNPRRKKNVFLIGMNMLYYFAFLALIVMLILPHTSIWYRWSPFSSFSERANTKTIYMVVGERYKIDLFDMGGFEKYSSSDFKVATVDGFGIITGLRTGKTVITITADKKTYKFRVYVVGLSKKKISMRTGSYKKIKVEGYSRGVTYKNKHSNIATVNRFGIIHAKKKGTAIIEVRVKGKVLKCKVKVT